MRYLAFTRTPVESSATKVTDDPYAAAGARRGTERPWKSYVKWGVDDDHEPAPAGRAGFRLTGTFPVRQVDRYLGRTHPRWSRPCLLKVASGEAARQTPARRSAAAGTRGPRGSPADRGHAARWLRAAPVPAGVLGRGLQEAAPRKSPPLPVESRPVAAAAQAVVAPPTGHQDTWSPDQYPPAIRTTVSIAVSVDPSTCVSAPHGIGVVASPDGRGVQRRMRRRIKPTAARAPWRSRQRFFGVWPSSSALEAARRRNAARRSSRDRRGPSEDQNAFVIRAPARVVPVHLARRRRRVAGRARSPQDPDPPASIASRRAAGTPRNASRSSAASRGFRFTAGPLPCWLAVPNATRPCSSGRPRLTRVIRAP